MSGLFWFLPLTPCASRFTTYDGRCAMLFHGHGHVLNACALYLTIKNLSYILWCIAPQVKRSSNEVLLEP